MNQVRTYTLEITDESQYLQLPYGALFLDVHVDQHNDIQMVFLIDEQEKDNVEREFKIFGTDWLVPNNALYRKTVMTDNNYYTWHIFELV